MQQISSDGVGLGAHLFVFSISFYLDKYTTPTTSHLGIFANNGRLARLFGMPFRIVFTCIRAIYKPFLH